MSNETRPAARKWLTRPAVARRLGTSVASVRRLEGRLLHPERNERGVWLFALDEVERLAASYAPKHRRRSISDGEVAARAFQLFESGHDLTQIVVRLRQHPHVIRILYEEWQTDLATGHYERQAEKDHRELQRAMRLLR